MDPLIKSQMAISVEQTWRIVQPVLGTWANKISAACLPPGALS